jgi:hypothetical protein
VLLVAGRHVVGNEGHVDIGLSDEEGLHTFPVMAWVVPAGDDTLAPVVPYHSLKLFANAASLIA